MRMGTVRQWRNHCRFSGENAHPADWHRERFLFRGRAHRYRPVRRAVPGARVLRRVHHSHGAVRVRVRVRHAVHQGNQTGARAGQQGAAAAAAVTGSLVVVAVDVVVSGVRPGLFQPFAHQRGGPGDVQRGPAQQAVAHHLANGRRHRGHGALARYVNVQDVLFYTGARGTKTG